MADYNSASTLLFEGFQLKREKQSKLIDLMFFKQIINELIYLTYTHLYITYLVNIVSHYMNASKKLHLEATHHIFKYLKGTQNYKVFYQEGDFVKHIARVHKHGLGCYFEKWKSTLRYLFN